MASVAKWLRQRIVVPPFVGSSPIVRPSQYLYGLIYVRSQVTIPEYIALLDHISTLLNTKIIISG